MSSKITILILCIVLTLFHVGCNRKIEDTTHVQIAQTPVPEDTTVQLEKNAHVTSGDCGPYLKKDTSDPNTERWMLFWGGTHVVNVPRSLLSVDTDWSQDPQLTTSYKGGISYTLKIRRRDIPCFETHFQKVFTPL